MPAEQEDERAGIFDREDVDRLYDLDPSEFVPARDALAKQVRKDGDRDAAAAVRALRRPTVTAWALNQVARRQPDDVATLLEAAEAVADAQVAAVGDGSPEVLRAATRRRRELVSALARAATALAGPPHADEIEATLLSASTDPEAGAALAAGRLVRELAAPSGFGLFGVAEPDPPAAEAVDQGGRKAAEAPQPVRTRRSKIPTARKVQVEQAGSDATAERTATAPGKAIARPATSRDGDGGPRKRTPAARAADATADGTAADRRATVQRAADEQAASARAAELERRRQDAAAAAEALAAAASAVGAAERGLADATAALSSARATLARASAAYDEASSALAELDG